jgi:hypothetical protein
MATIDEFRTNFKGVRANRFRVSGSYPAGIEATNIPAGTFEFYCKAASVPGSAIGVIPVGYKGRPIKFSGERTYADWLIQIYDSTNTDLRTNFEKWIEAMDGRQSHQINYNVAAGSGNSATWTVEYMEQASGSTQSTNNVYQKKMKLVNCFPVDLSPIELSYDSPDTFAEFTVTLTYDYWDYI